MDLLSYMDAFIFACDTSCMEAEIIALLTYVLIYLVTHSMEQSPS